jgi:hypothetical protein
MIQFTIPSDPVGSEVLPEAKDLEIDSKKETAGLSVSDWLRGTGNSRFLQICEEP